MEYIDELNLSWFHSPFLSAGVFEMHPEVFEKDDDSNSHIDFITAASVRSISFHTSTASLCPCPALNSSTLRACVTLKYAKCTFGERSHVVEK